jgi:hypothetical protein
VSATRGRATIAILTVAAALAVGLAPTGSASAATFVGQLFVPQNSCSGDTYLQTGVAEGNTYTVTTPGAITFWNFYVGTEAIPGLALKVAQPLGGGFYVIVGEAVAGKQLTNQVNTFSADIGVEPGDIIGIYTLGSSGFQNCGTAAPGVPGDSYVYAFGNWGPGTVTQFQTPLEGTEHGAGELEAPNAIFPVQAWVSNPPITELPVPECSSGSFLGTVYADYPTIPKAIHFTVDGGPEGTAKASTTEIRTMNGVPTAVGQATIKGVPVGTHTLEWWGEDKANDLERVHHAAQVFVTKEKPHLNVTSEQGKSSYNEGERGSVKIRANSSHGLALDPSTSHIPIETTHPGLFLVPSETIDNCGNKMTETFSYTVAPIDTHLKLSHSSFVAAHSGPSAVAGRASGTQISYTASDEGQTSFVVIKGIHGVKRGRNCATARKKVKQGGKPCTVFGEDLVGEFSTSNEQGANAYHFSGRVGGHTLKPGTYRLSATPETDGIYGKTLKTIFTVLP